MKKLFTGLILLTASFASSAGIITDTNNNSFIDETTGLEWIDFGINNHQTYDYVSSQLGLGGEYEGWRLATEDDVFIMMANAFLGLGATYAAPDYHGAGQLKVNDGKNKLGSVMSPIFESMGHNYVIYSGHKFEQQASYGLFESTKGLGLIQQYEFTGSERDITYDDQAQFRTSVDFSWHTDNTSPLYSTMLIRNDIATDVPEPSTLAIFALGMFGLASRTFKKQNL